MYLMMRSKTCRVPWIKKHTAPAVNRDASSELPKTVHIFPEIKFHTFPEVYMFLYFLKYIFKNVILTLIPIFNLCFCLHSMFEPPKSIQYKSNLRAFDSFSENGDVPLQVSSHGSVEDSIPYLDIYNRIVFSEKKTYTLFAV